MELDRYVDAELAEEQALGLQGSEAWRDAVAGYAGDPQVTVRPEDVRIDHLSVTIDGRDVVSELLTPGGPAEHTLPVPGVIVVHENKGLVPYVHNTARRLARHGFATATPDLLAGHGGTASFASDSDATSALRARSAVEMIGDLRATLDAMAAHPKVDAGRLAVVGFCFGGGLAWRLLAAEHRLRAGVPFYGPPPTSEELASIQAPVLAIYGERDDRITSTRDATERAMRENGKSLTVRVYEDAGHAFHNDSNPDRYHPQAAAAAWAETLRFLDEHLDVGAPA